jgi:hypothetical protein
LLGLIFPGTPRRNNFMDRLPNAGQDIYRLIVTRRNGSEVLLSGRGNSWSLPSLGISHGQRVAEQLCAELYAKCGFRAYCLFVPTLAPGSPRCAVMEAPDLGGIASARSCWKPLDVATCAALESAEDRTIIEKSLEELDFYRREPNQGPFARAGWLLELLAWAQQQLDSFGICLTGAFSQLNASPAFSLIRLETNDSAVWFKAAGEPNRHELPITACITRLFPAYVPELLGVHAAWNGWLTRDVSGRTLDHGAEPSSWSKVAGALARLQILSIGNETDLLEGHCKDLRLPRLVEQIDPFIDRMREFMPAQEKQTPAPLTDPELTRLGGHLKQACSALCDVGLPDTLGHLDFNPGNILVSPERSVFLDWAEACVTNPLMTFEYLREHLRRNCPDNTHAIDDIVAIYTRPWLSFFSPDALRKATVISPLVAVFAYTVGTYTWRSREALLKPATAAYLRSLTRRMHREALAIFGRREPCLA